MIRRLSVKVRLARAAVAMLLAAGALAGLGATTAPATAAPHSFTTIGKGGDSCSAPSVSQMSAFFRNTPYLAWGIYLGGEDRACSQPNLTASWVTQVTGQGWALLPLWVGPQNPCLAGFDHFSTNTSTAYGQGQTEARAAYNALVKLGMAANSPIIYDMEAGGSNSATCINATKSFVQGWVNQLAVSPAQPSGIYTSTCAGFLDDFASLSPPPTFIDGADYNGVISTSNLPCVSIAHWTQHQRHKQYAGGHNETWNGVTLNMDSTCSNAPAVATAAYNGNNGCL
ncbi:MAG: DUF1906 domain-containing protein [Jatrophihabitans sp.]